MIQISNSIYQSHFNVQNDRLIIWLLFRNQNLTSLAIFSFNLKVHLKEKKFRILYLKSNKNKNIILKLFQNQKWIWYSKQK